MVLRCFRCWAVVRSAWLGQSHVARDQKPGYMSKWSKKTSNLHQPKMFPHPLSSSSQGLGSPKNGRLNTSWAPGQVPRGKLTWTLKTHGFVEENPSFRVPGSIKGVRSEVGGALTSNPLTSRTSHTGLWGPPGATRPCTVIRGVQRG